MKTLRHTLPTLFERAMRFALPTVLIIFASCGTHSVDDSSSAEQETEPHAKQAQSLRGIGTVIEPASPFAQSRTYRTTDDFAEGTVVNVAFDRTPNQVEMNPTIFAPYPYINIAASGRGTIVRIDVNSGAIVGEYRTAPGNLARDPSRTTVDLEGNVWCGNRAQTAPGSVVKVGLVIGGTRGTKMPDGNFSPDPTGQYLAPPFTYNSCTDRDNDGLIKTSKGYNDALAWPDNGDGQVRPDGTPVLVNDADDECILIFQRLPETRRVRHVSVDSENNVWVGGWDDFAVNKFWKLDGRTGARLTGFKNNLFCSPNLNVGGYGGLVDGNNVLWSASSNSTSSKLFRYDLTSQVGTCLNAPNSYGLTVDRDGNIWNCLYQLHQVRKFAPDGTILGTFGIGQQGARGLAASPVDGHVWIAASISQQICRLSPEGVVLKTLSTGGSDPTGVAIDSNGKVWVTNNGSGTVKRIDPNGGADGLGAVDLTVNIGGSVYNYSDMTGTVVVSSTAPRGTWTVIHDGGANDILWGRASWTSAEPEGTAIVVDVRAANDRADLASKPLTRIENAESFAQSRIAGRYIQSQVTFSRTGGSDISPVLYDLTISSAGAFSDVTSATELDFFDTTFNRDSNLLVTRATARNSSQFIMDAPVVMVVDNVTDPAVRLANPDGYTPDGKPFVVFAAPEFGAPILEPGQSTPPRPVIFSNTGGLINFTRSWLASANGPPDFSSVPAAQVVVGRSYEYAPSVSDPDGHAVSFRKFAGPSALMVNDLSGRVLWTPQDDDIGVHAIAITAVDSRGAATTQRFSVEVLSRLPNRPPVITSQASTRVSVGAAYSYQASATDADGDTVAFAKVEGPDSLSVAPDGTTAWDFALPPTQRVGIRAEDGNGGNAEQYFTLTVGDQPANASAPSLLGIPDTLAVIGQGYVYQPVASDPDPGDMLTFTLTTFPSGAIVDPVSGRVTWTPTAGQIGSHDIRLRVDDRADGTGNIAAQQWAIEVVATAPNRAPVIDSLPTLFAVVGQPYAYQVHAVDPESQTPQYTLIDPPIGMAIDQGSGLLSWTPSDVGPVTIAIRASDPAGAAGNQVYILDVSPPNIPPHFVSTPQLATVIGAIYRYDGNALDANGHALKYMLEVHPQGMWIDSNSGLVTWTPSPSQVGDHVIVLKVDDLFGGADTQDFTITVRPDSMPPVVQIVPTPGRGVIGQPVQVCVRATDDGSIIEQSLTVDGAPVELDDSGCYSITPSDVGILALNATATDGAENTGTASLDYQVVDPNDPTAPSLMLHSPLPDATVTAPIEVVATINDNTPETLLWQVRLTRADTTDVKVIAHGSGPVTNGVVAMLDPTLLPNDNYALLLYADDGVHSVTSGHYVNIAGDYKLGNFTVSFTDLTIPVAGIPLVITRTYDSLDTTSGDFGPGWRLGLPGRVCDSASEYPTFDTWTTSTRVYVTRPDGRRVGFKIRLEPLVQSFIGNPFGFQRVFLDPEPGVTDSLELLEDNVVSVAGGQLGTALFLETFNPRRFLFTSREKVKYTFDEQLGLEKIEDIFGNTIDVTPTGLQSSTGVSLTFVRDAQGRITKITEPDDPNDPDPPGTLDYVYDPQGNLAEFWTQQKSDPPTRYYYEDNAFPHYLTRIQDPMNHPIVQNVFDASGRLVGQCNAMGDPLTLPSDPCADLANVPEHCVMFCIDGISGVQTIINARGHRTDLVLDERGNILEERKFSDPTRDHDNDGQPDGPFMLVTQRSYWRTSTGDLTDWMQTESLQTRVAVGQAAGSFPARETRTYDARGNVLSHIEHGDEDREWVYSYWPGCDKVATETDPMDNVTSYQYDTKCNLRFVTDALGGVTEYRYNAEGQVTYFIDAVLWNGIHPNSWQFHYDSYGLPAGMTDPLGNSSQTRFNLAGELEYHVDRRGWRMDFEYDLSHRRRREIWQPNQTAMEPGDLAAPRVTEYSYNAAGLITSAVDPDNALHIDYWPTGLVKWVDNDGTPDTPRVRMTYGRWDDSALEPGYDSNGNVIHVMDEWFEDSAFVPHGINEYSYDEFDRMIKAQQYPLGAPVQPKHVQVDYGDTGIPIEIRRYSSLSTSPLTAIGNTTIDYDCFGCPGRVREIRHEMHDGNMFDRITYTRDSLGNVTNLTDLGETRKYSYDGLRRLLAVDYLSSSNRPREHYSYDAVGNRNSSHISAFYSYSYQTHRGGNRLTEDDSYVYTYDREGNLIVQVAKADNATQTFLYDHRNRLRFYEGHVMNGTRTTAQLQYDAMGRRVGVVSGATALHTVYDGYNAFLVVDSTTEHVRRHFYGRALDSLFATEVNNELTWYFTDQLGTARVQIDGNGEVRSRTSLDSFGNLHDPAPVESNESALFQGRTFDGFSKLWFFRARFYNPETARYTQEDPLWPRGYGFVHNNPLSFVDPLGEQPILEYIVKFANLAITLHGLYELYVLAGDCINGRPVTPTFFGIEGPTVPGKLGCAVGVTTRFSEWLATRGIQRMVPPPIDYSEQARRGLPPELRPPPPLFK